MSPVQRLGLPAQNIWVVCKHSDPLNHSDFCQPLIQMQVSYNHDRQSGETIKSPALGWLSGWTSPRLQSLRHFVFVRFSSPVSFSNTSWRSKGVICKTPVHLQRCHLHVWCLGVLEAPRGAVSSGPSHGAESRRGTTDVGQSWSSRHGVTPQEPARCHQVSVALRVREGVAWATGAGAADLPASSWRRRRCFGLSHFAHHL